MVKLIQTWISHMLKMLRKYLSYPLTNLFNSRCRFLLATAVFILVLDHFGLLSHLFEVDYRKFTYPLDVPMEDYIVALKTGKEPPLKPINEYPFTFTIRNDRKCRSDDSGEYEKVAILYVVKSALDNKDRRNVIRRTWGWEKRFSDVLIRRIFVVGTSDTGTHQARVEEEYALYKDIVQADFVDNYYNNTIKTVMSLRWVVQNCPKVQFIVFSDDDMYISTKNMLKFIRNPFNRRVGFRKRRDIESSLKLNQANSELLERNGSRMFSRKLNYDPILSAFDGRLFAGFVFDSSPMRHKSSKWYVTLGEYPYSKYPPYVTAGAFVLSYPALEDMYYASLFTKHFRFDDIYLGIVAKKCKIHPYHNEHFHFWKKPYYKESYANVIASHGYRDPEELQKVWDEQRSSGHA